MFSDWFEVVGEVVPKNDTIDVPKQKEFTPEMRCPKKCVAVEWLSHWCKTISESLTLENEVSMRRHLIENAVLCHTRKV